MPEHLELFDLTEEAGKIAETLWEYERDIKNWKLIGDGPRDGKMYTGEVPVLGAELEKMAERLGFVCF
jgi:hypothetical protein